MGLLASTKVFEYWIAGVVSASAIASLLTILIAGNNQLGFTLSASSERGERKRQYDQLDAVAACREEAQERFDGQLVRSFVNDHSTRYETERGVYLVVLDAHVGNRKRFDEAQVYCYIRPETNKVTYFRAYDGNKKSFQSGGGFAAWKAIFGKGE